MTSIAKKMVPSEQSFLEALSSADPKNDSFIVIAHDIKQLTVSILAEYMLQTVKEKGFRAVTVGECLGDPSENWYRPGGGNAIVKGTLISLDSRGSCAETDTFAATVNATTGTVTGENKSPATLLKAGLAVPVLAAVILGFLVAS